MSGLDRLSGILISIRVPRVILGVALLYDSTSPAAEINMAVPSSALQLAFTQLSAGVSHTCGVTTDKQAYCWGWNSKGQLGDGTITQRLAPVPVGGGLTFLKISAGGQHTCGLTTQNTAYCWGSNEHGQLGDGTTMDRLTPTGVMGGHQFAQISTGGQYACGVTTQALAFCWGLNGGGQLGDGTQINRPQPTAVAGPVKFGQISTGSGHTCAITPLVKGAGTAYCWGSNGTGTLGDGTTTDRLEPVAVVGALRFQQISAGGMHTCGVVFGRAYRQPLQERAYCWGINEDGSFGDGTELTWRPKPVPVSGGLRFSQVHAGQGHTCGAERLFKKAYCWGSNGGGQLGDGTATDRLVPTAVGGGLSFLEITTGSWHTCGVATTNVAYCWGSNYRGVLGDGTTSLYRRVPTAVAGSI
jgi:alpha-tubulin suppressor-like RCC1 family protein